MGFKGPRQLPRNLRSDIQQIQRILISTGPPNQLEDKERDDEVPTAEEVTILRKDISETIRVRDLSYFLAFFLSPLILVSTSFGRLCFSNPGHRLLSNSPPLISRISILFISMHASSFPP